LLSFPNNKRLIELARYRGPKEKIERRLGTKLFLKGERSYSPKSALTKRPYPPGTHGSKGQRRLSEYGLQLQSKQRVRNTYRILEKQFKAIVKDSMKSKSETGSKIMEKLEKRLDNIVFRSGFAQSRDQARQLVNHGHITVNSKRVDIPSYKVRKNDTISIREESKKIPYFSSLMPQWFEKYEAPGWISLDKGKISSKIIGTPSMEDSGLNTSDLRAIVEYYSR